MRYLEREMVTKRRTHSLGQDMQSDRPSSIIGRALKAADLQACGGRESKRDFGLAIQVAQLPDWALIGSRELAALLGYSIHTIQQNKVDLPAALPGRRKMMWRLGDVKAYFEHRSPHRTKQDRPPALRERPPKAQQALR